MSTPAEDFARTEFYIRLRAVHPVAFFALAKLNQDLDVIKAKMIKQLEREHEASQRVFGDLLLRFNLYPTTNPKAVKRPVATARDIEELRTAQLGVIAAALRWHMARDLSAGSIEAEQTKLRTLSTEEYRTYLAGSL